MTVQNFVEKIDKNSFVYIHRGDKVEKIDAGEKISDEIKNLEITKIRAESMYIFSIDTKERGEIFCLTAS